MPCISMSVATPAAGDAYYVDTSGVYALMMDRAVAAKKAAPCGESARAGALLQFLKRVARAGGRAVTSVLAFEEVAASVRNGRLASAATTAKYASWKAFMRADPARAELQPAQAMTLAMLTFAVDGVSNAGIEVLRPAVLEADARARAKDLRLAHRKLLSTCEHIDSMDALHIAVGAELGVTAYVSFDKAWGAVAGITVCGA
jgi:predicted nucleic acid-binding protein